jgi:site-specific DNA recombinase
MSAARRKGKWVGGKPVLGYEIDSGGGRLIVNAKEAGRVRQIFELYQKHHSLSAVVAELARRRWKTKSWRSQRQTAHSGKAFTKVSLRRLLTNAIYAGKVEHRGAIYSGEQAAIVEPAVWEQVNDELRATRRQGARAVHTKQNALLAGLLYCRSCNQPMLATYTGRRGRRYRYYVCQAAREKGWDCCPTKSVNAGLIEESVIDQLRNALKTSETREQLQVSDADWQGFEQGDRAGVVRAVLKQIRYDGTTGAVSLELSANESGI